jgi:hypothetical protein
MEENQKKTEIIDLSNIKKVGEFLLYVKFMGTPVQFRKDIYGYKTETDFAEKHNVNKDTLTTWKNRDGFHEAIMRETRKFCTNKTPAVIGAMLNKIMANGDKSEVELWLRIFEDYRDVNDINLISDIDKRTDDFRKILESWQKNENTGEPSIDLISETPQAVERRLSGSPESA